jgi:hypothetical protein
MKSGIITVIMSQDAVKDEGWVNPEKEKPNYLQIFNERLDKLTPLPEQKTLEVANKFKLDELGLYPTKIIPAILYTSLDGGDFQVLLPNVEKYEHYRLEDHTRTLDEFGLAFQEDSTYSGFIVVDTRNNKYLLINYLQATKFVEDGTARVKDCLSRYGITAGFSLGLDPDNDTGYILDNSHRNSLVPEGVDLVDVVQELLGNDVVLQLAKVYGLTYTEYLRFKLTGNLPGGKTHPSQINS